MPEVYYQIGSDYPVLGAWMRSRAPVSIIIGPRGSGKTFGAAQRCLMHIREQAPNERGIRPTRGLVTRDSYSELENTTIPDFMAVMGDVMELRKGTSGTPTARWKPGRTLEDGTTPDAEVIFQSSGVQDAPERAKGYQLTYAWFNEFSGSDPTFFQRVREALGRYPSPAAGGVRCTWRGAFCDTNSFDDTHWLFPLVTDPPEGWEIFRQPGGVIDSGRVDARGRKIWRDNPNAENLKWLPEGYYSELCSGASDDAIKVLLANEFGFFIDGMPVHPWYVDSVHCAPEPFEPEPRLPIIIGADFGRTPAAALLQFHPAMGRWAVFDELTSQNMSASVFAPELKRKLDRDYPNMSASGFGDPAGDKSGQTVEVTPIQMMRAAGLDMRPAPTNVETIRRASLSNPGRRLCMDGKPAFILSPRCKMLRKGMMGGFCYKRMRLRGTEQYAQEPDKTSIYSHIVEAAEYACSGGGEARAALRPAESQLYDRPPSVEIAEGSWW
jgi:hypothetical protein